MYPDLKKFVKAFLKDSGYPASDTDFLQIPSDGSKRLFWRITLSTPKARLVAMANPPISEALRRENLAYVMIGIHLHRKGVPVPQILRYDLERGWFIMEDMGNTCLQDLVTSGSDPLPTYDKVLEHLFRLQIEGARDFDTKWCCQTEKYDLVVMRKYEADYFREAFLYHYLGLKREWPELEPPFVHLAQTASRADNNLFLHRDFQSRNIMMSKEKIGIIDWQGARLGPLGYDLASLLIDPYANLSSRQRHQIYNGYLALIKAHNNKWVGPFERSFPYLAIQRNLQILGAFSYLATTMHKKHFEAYIPAALKTLHELLHQLNDGQLSPLSRLVEGLIHRQKTLRASLGATYLP